MMWVIVKYCERVSGWNFEIVDFFCFQGDFQTNVPEGRVRR